MANLLHGIFKYCAGRKPLRLRSSPHIPPSPAPLPPQHGLLKLPWPTQRRFLYTWNRNGPGDLARVLDANYFQMVGWLACWQAGWPARSSRGPGTTRVYVWLARCGSPVAHPATSVVN